jgi:hypothetical protein
MSIWVWLAFFRCQKDRITRANYQTIVSSANTLIKELIMGATFRLVGVT